MGERRNSEALALWRALALGSTALLLASMGERMLHRAPPERTAAAAALSRAEPLAQTLPPEWRWRARTVPVERLYGATPRD